MAGSDVRDGADARSLSWTVIRSNGFGLDVAATVMPLKSLEAETPAAAGINSAHPQASVPMGRRDRRSSVR